MYLTPRDVAARLNCTPRWIQRLCAEGHLPFVRIGSRAIRIPADALDAFLAARTK